MTRRLRRVGALVAERISLVLKSRCTLLRVIVHLDTMGEIRQGLLLLAGAHPIGSGSGEASSPVLLSLSFDLRSQLAKAAVRVKKVMVYYKY